jgi:DNA-binding transcriptional LysR family regulator
LRGPRYDLYTMLAQAAAAGVGVALIPRILITEELAQGRLVVPLATLPAERDNRKAYYFAHRRGLAPDDKVLQLRDWLLERGAWHAPAVIARGR